MASSRKDISQPSSRDEVDAFLAKVNATPAPVAAANQGRQGRLMFAMDATASREPSWDQACHIQSEMFDATANLGGLDVQLCYFRGFREFRASSWVADARRLARLMGSVRCAGGRTQIGRALEHALAETRTTPVNALVFIGDCMEEDIDALCASAGELGLLGVPVFIFHEGRDLVAERCFREICRLSRGAYCRFDAGSAEHLRELLAAVAVYAAGGRKALADLGARRGGAIRQLSHDLKR
ncbi:MAG: hypothetical protein ACI9DC_002291 [Gammaproteobacteria bacterium]